MKLVRPLPRLRPVSVLPLPKREPPPRNDDERALQKLVEQFGPVDLDETKDTK